MKGNRYFIFTLLLLSINYAEKTEKEDTIKGQSHVPLNAQKIQVVSMHWFANERIFLLPTHFLKTFLHKGKKVI